MKFRKLIATGSSLMVLTAMLVGCDTGPPTATPASGAQPAATTNASNAGAAAGTAKGVTADTYIPIISKGFQHQFWQAVKLGSENAAKEFNVKTNFVGPESESQ